MSHEYLRKDELPQRAINDEIAEQIYAAVLNGKNLTDACKDVGVAYQTFLTFRKRHPNYNERLKRAKLAARRNFVGIVEPDEEAEKKVLKAFDIMEQGPFSHLSVCKAVGIRITTFYRVIENCPVMKKRYLHLLEGVHTALLDKSMERALNDGSIDMLKFLMNNLSSNVGSESPVIKTAERQQINADVDLTVRPAKIIDMS